MGFPCYSSLRFLGSNPVLYSSYHTGFIEELNSYPQYSIPYIKFLNSNPELQARHIKVPQPSVTLGRRSKPQTPNPFLLVYG